MGLYQWIDVSHHKGFIPGQEVAKLGHRLIGRKASDNYHMPDKNGVFDFAADRHHDAWFVEGVKSDREAGIVSLWYHFARFDRPLVSRPQIVQANLTYFLNALRMLVDAGILTDKQFKEIPTVVLDMEQDAGQLRQAGFNPKDANINAMAKDMVTLYLERFKNVILYSGSWWTDEWLSTATTEWMATEMSVWEPEYKDINSVSYPINPEYRPSVPKGFQNVYTEKATDIIGKLFAWQYTNRGKLPGRTANIDMNLTAMPKEQLYILLNLDGAVDPPPPTPPPPPPPDCTTQVRNAQIATYNKAIIKVSAVLNELKAERDALKPEPTEPPPPVEPPPPPPPSTVTVLVRSDKPRVPLSYPKLGYNDADPPRLILEIFPGAGSNTDRRVLVMTNTFVTVFKDPIKTDGGEMYYKIADYDSLTFFENTKENIPADFSPEKDLKALYIHTKFL